MAVQHCNATNLPVHPAHHLQANSDVRELVTPPLDGTILPGVTRDSILQLTRQWGEFEVSERQLSIKELKQVRCPGSSVLNCAAAAAMQSAGPPGLLQCWQA